MILQALTEYYEALVEKGIMARPGWSPVKVHYALCINGDGQLEELISLEESQTVKQKNGKEKTQIVPQQMELPAPVKRASGIVANFLCDKSSYMLGDEDKPEKAGKPKRALECFETCRQLHHKVLDEVQSPAAAALLKFFDRWEPEKTREHPALQASLADILSGKNLIFRYEGAYVHEDPAVRKAWTDYYDDTEDAEKGICLITGEETAIVGVHPPIKGVAGAQSSGAAMVSFNAPAFCSFGKSQSYNAPTGKYAAFAYTSALNYLISDRREAGKRAFRIGDTTVVCWAKNAEPAYQDAMGAFLGNDDSYTEHDLREMMSQLLQGNKVDFEESLLDPDMDFYILGIAPNAARLSVRFFLHNSFSRFVKNIMAHYDRLEIVRPSFEKYDLIPIWALLQETVNMNSKDKSPAPDMAGQVLRAVLNDTLYPATLLNGVQLRIRAEHKISRGRAAIIKAYYMQKAAITKREDPNIPEEVLKVSLNEEATNIAYVLGRVFSVLEDIQGAANPGINTTITDKYFNSASATPAIVFPTLINLARKHLSKIQGSNPGAAVNFQKQLNELMPKDIKEFPARMNLAQQGSFQLGYYFQTQKRYQKKENKEEK